MNRLLWILDDGFQLGQALFELAAHHFIAVHNKAHSLTDKIILAKHAPGDNSLTVLFLKR